MGVLRNRRLICIAVLIGNKASNYAAPLSPTVLEPTRLYIKYHWHVPFSHTIIPGTLFFHATQLDYHTHFCKPCSNASSMKSPSSLALDETGIPLCPLGSPISRSHLFLLLLLECKSVACTAYLSLPPPSKMT